MPDYSIAVIGSGVVGCAIARELAARQPGRKTIVLEKLSGPGLETSRFNSGVLHSGIHEKPTFLKARFARDGTALAVNYHRQRRLPIRECGMIVAISGDAIRRGLWKELPLLISLRQRGKRQGILFKLITPWALRRLEPQVHALGGIFIPSVWVIQPEKFVQSLYRDACAGGIDFSFANGVSQIEVRSDHYRINTANGEVSARAIVNCAGLYADEVARMAGIGGYRIYPWRGEYYEIINPRYSQSISHLINPVMPHQGGKGILLGPRTNGRLFIGPNSRPVPNKNYYEEDKTPVEVFVEAASRFLPNITADDMRWAYAGLRPKLTATPAESDFVVRLDRQEPPLINLIAIESPGLSSAMAIGRYVSDLLGST